MGQTAKIIHGGKYRIPALTALIRNFYKAIMQRIEVKKFGLKETSRIKTFVFNLKSATPFPKCYLQKRNGLLIRKTAIKSSRPFHCAYHPLPHKAT